MTVKAIVNYHVRRNGKQAFRFDADGIVGNLISPELIPTEVQVTDLRDGDFSVNFANDGITFAKHRSQILDFEQQQSWAEAYDDELDTLLKDQLGAQEVIIFDHTVRVDDPNAERRPARNVHTDYSARGADQRLVDLLGERKASEFKGGHYGFVNVWRPVEQIITASPLGFIRASSILPEDWMTIDLIYPNRIGEILGVAVNREHEWFYLSRMSPDEVAIFNIYDNKNIPRVGHSALDVLEVGDTKHPIRKSIESRTLIRY